MKNSGKVRSLSAALVGIMLLLLAVASGTDVTAQCVDDASGRTAVKLSNQTQRDVVFGIDDDAKGVVTAHKDSALWDVEPGPHLLIAGAIVEDRVFWVWVNNDVPKGQVCTWILEDPKQITTSLKYVDGNIRVSLSHRPRNSFITPQILTSEKANKIVC